jgi:hypothetical protein
MNRKKAAIEDNIKSESSSRHRYIVISASFGHGRGVSSTYSACSQSIRAIPNEVRVMQAVVVRLEARAEEIVSGNGKTTIPR